MFANWLVVRRAARKAVCSREGLQVGHQGVRYNGAARGAIAQWRRPRSCSRNGAMGYGAPMRTCAGAPQWCHGAELFAAIFDARLR